MKITAIIALGKSFGKVQLSAVISVISFVHIAKARRKLKTILSFADFTFFLKTFTSISGPNRKVYPKRV